MDRERRLRNMVSHVLTRDFGFTDLDSGRFRLHSRGELLVKDGLIALGLRASDVRSVEDLKRAQEATAEYHLELLTRSLEEAEAQRLRKRRSSAVVI